MTASDMPEPDGEAGTGREGSAETPGPRSASQLRHELRTPINHIIGYSELLLEEVKDHQLKPFTSDVKKIHTAGRTLLGMINALFESPTLITGSPSSPPQPARDLPPLLDEDAEAQRSLSLERTLPHLVIFWS